MNKNIWLYLFFNCINDQDPLSEFKICKVEFGSPEHLAADENTRKGYLTIDSKCRNDYVPMFLSYYGRDDEYAVKFFLDYLLEKFKTVAKKSDYSEQAKNQLDKIYHTFLAFLDLNYKLKHQKINLDNFVVENVDLPFDLEKFKNKSLKENDYYEDY